MLERRERRDDAYRLPKTLDYFVRLAVEHDRRETSRNEEARSGIVIEIFDLYLYGTADLNVFAESYTNIEYFRRITRIRISFLIGVTVQ